MMLLTMAVIVLAVLGFLLERRVRRVEERFPPPTVQQLEVLGRELEHWRAIYQAVRQEPPAHRAAHLWRAPSEVWDTDAMETATDQIGSDHAYDSAREAAAKRPANRD